MERFKAALSQAGAAELLGVTARTVRNWEAGRARVPYSAFKLMRILRGYALPGQAWNGFVLRGDTIWSPEGKAFTAHDLGWWSLTCAMARQFRLMRSAQASLQARSDGSCPPSLPADERAARGLVESSGRGSVSSPVARSGVATTAYVYEDAASRRFVVSGAGVVPALRVLASGGAGKAVGLPASAFASLTCQLHVKLVRISGHR